jgi:primase-polymerase (primpol)-like protein
MMRDIPGQGAKVATMIEVDVLPVDLRESDRAVLWNRELRDGKPTKVPYQVHRPAQKAAVDDPATWAPFRAAVAAYADGKADGVGVVLGGGVVGVDLDSCRDPATGTITPEAQGIIDALNSNTEISPSGTGVHILLRGTLPPTGRRKGKVEMYSTGRYFTVSSQHVEGTPTKIEARDVELSTLHGRLFAANGSMSPRRPPRQVVAVRDDDAVLLARASNARNGAAFSSLWAGDTHSYGGDDSAADLSVTISRSTRTETRRTSIGCSENQDSCARNGTSAAARRHTAR